MSIGCLISISIPNYFALSTLSVTVLLYKVDDSENKKSPTNYINRDSKTKLTLKIIVDNAVKNIKVSLHQIPCDFPYIKNIATKQLEEMMKSFVNVTLHQLGNNCKALCKTTDKKQNRLGSKSVKERSINCCSQKSDEIL